MGRGVEREEIGRGVEREEIGRGEKIGRGEGRDEIGRGVEREETGRENLSKEIHVHIRRQREGVRHNIMSP